MSNIFIGLKMTCLGVLDRGIRGDDNETSLEEGEGIKMFEGEMFNRNVNYSAPFAMLTLCIYLPIAVVNPLRTASAFLR